MANYYVNDTAQPTGEHEVHRSDCDHLPAQSNRTYLGDHVTCQSAVKAAKQHYADVDGCYHCSRACHTR